MSVEGIITLGIGSDPGSLMWFFTLGLYPGAAEEGAAGVCACTYSPYEIPFLTSPGEYVAAQEVKIVTFRYPTSMTTGVYKK